MKKKVAKSDEEYSEGQLTIAQYTNASSSYHNNLEPSPSTETSTDNINLVVSQHYDFSKETQRSPLLPRFLFAEWLSLDHVYSGNSTLQNDQNFQDSLLSHDEGFLLNDGVTYRGDEFQNGVGMALNSQYKFEEQALGNGFADFLSGNDVCSDLSQVMYM